MNGIKLSKEYYELFGKPMIHNQFHHIEKYIAAGLCGQGSECYGYDDMISRDHDYEPGFIIFIPDESIVSRRDAFLLERAYSALPKEYKGIKRQMVSPVGGSRRGVMRTSDFFTKFVGENYAALSLSDWLYIPDHLIFEATNGEIFSDEYGEVTSVRQSLLSMPEDIRRKRLAGRLLLMSQSGEYNYSRCILHGETAAAQLCLFEFVRRCIEVIFLLNRKYMPYYKWAFRALKELDYLGSAYEDLEFIISSDNSEKNIAKKTKSIEKICRLISDATEAQCITEKFYNLDRLAYSVNDSIKDISIRSMNIFCTV